MENKILLRISNIKGQWTEQLVFDDFDKCIEEADALVDLEKTWEAQIIDFTNGKGKITTLKEGKGNNMTVNSLLKNNFIKHQNLIKG